MTNDRLLNSSLSVCASALGLLFPSGGLGWAGERCAAPLGEEKIELVGRLNMKNRNREEDRRDRGGRKGEDENEPLYTMRQQPSNTVGLWLWDCSFLLH
jgi:hypothetical protein